MNAHLFFPHLYICLFMARSLRSLRSDFFLCLLSPCCLKLAFHRHMSQLLDARCTSCRNPLKANLCLGLSRSIPRLFHLVSCLPFFLFTCAIYSIIVQLLWLVHPLRICFYKHFVYTYIEQRKIFGDHVNEEQKLNHYSTRVWAISETEKPCETVFIFSHEKQGQPARKLQKHDFPMVFLCFPTFCYVFLYSSVPHTMYIQCMHVGTHWGSGAAPCVLLCCLFTLNGSANN